MSKVIENFFKAGEEIEIEVDGKEETLILDAEQAASLNEQVNEK